MKKTIVSITAAVLMTVSFSSFASSVYKPLEAKAAKEILANYVSATSIGINDLHKSVFTTDFKFVNEANNSTYGKKDYLKFLNENKGVSYDCVTSHEIIDQNNDVVVAKTTYKFSDFTRVDHISMTQTKSGWKINKIATSYQ